MIRRFLFPLNRPFQRMCSTLPKDPPSSQSSFVNQRSMNAAFSEAREAIQDARESAETVYYSDDYADAEKITTMALDMYKSQLDAATAEDRSTLKAEYDLKMGQLREELTQLGAPH